MKNKDNTKEQLLKEIDKLSNKIADLEKSEVKYKQAEEKLKESEEKFRYIVETTSEWIWEIDLNGRHTYSNNVGEKLFGYSQKYISDMDALELIHPDDRRIFVQIYKQAIKTKVGWNNIVLRWRNTNGKYIYLESSAVPKFNNNNNLIGFIGVDHNITERKQAEKALKKSEDKCRALIDDVLDTSAIGTFILDSDFKVVWINRRTETFFGLKRDSVIGKDKRQLIQSKIKSIFEDSETFQQKIFNTYDNNTYIENFECHVLAEGDRKDRWLEHWSQPIKSGIYSGGRIEHYSDITERKIAEEALKGSESNYHKLFDDSPVALLKDDMSELFSYFAELKEKGVKDFRKYFTEHPTELQVCTTKIKALNINKQYLKLHKAKNKKELISNIFNTFTDISQNVFKEKMIAIASGKIEFESESEIKTLTNEVKKIYVKVKVKKIEANNINYTHGLLALFDITKRKQTEESLKQSEARYRRLFESSKDAIMTLEPPTWKFTSGNKAIFDTFGVKNIEEFTSLDPWEASPKKQPDGTSSAEKAKKEIQKAMKNGSNFFEWTHKRKNGEEFPATVLLTRVDLTGRSFLQATVRDITERKQTEKELVNLKNELEIKVAEQTKELKEKVSYLERFHDATIDRELRMKELRDEIDKFKKREKDEEHEL